MLEWLNQLSQPQNLDALAQKLAQKGPPPLDLLQKAQQSGGPGFAGMLGAGAPQEPAAPQTPMGIGGNAPWMAPAPAGAPPAPVPGAPAAAPAAAPAPGSPSLTGAQVAQLLQPQQQPALHFAPAAGVVGGGRIPDPQLMQTRPVAAMPSLAQLLNMRG